MASARSCARLPADCLAPPGWGTPFFEGSFALESDMVELSIYRSAASGRQVYPDLLVAQTARLETRKASRQPRETGRPKQQGLSVDDIGVFLVVQRVELVRCFRCSRRGDGAGLFSGHFSPK